MELLSSALQRRDRWPFHLIIESEENNIDPDDGNSWICNACTLPIFSTPFKISYQRSEENDNVRRQILLHDQCASLPEKLMDHPFHPGEALHLVKNEDSSSSTISCDKCSEKLCGSLFYKCRDYSCDLRLDLLCSLQVKILHRSHEHRLMVIRSSVSFICGACGTQHQGRSALSYFCNACDFRIQDCASLPNAIKLLQPEHRHSLFLTYDLSSSSKCAICGDVLQSLGVYLCVKCGYYVHITCATSDPHSFEPVLIRDAKLADLLHLPMEDERANLVQYLLENTTATDDEGGGGEGGDDDDCDDDGCRHDPKLKKHSLILHDEDDDDDDVTDEDDDDDGTGYSSRVCNACVQFISPPFYSCSNCRDFLLHSCCANLPRKIHHPIHPEHTLFLFSESPESGLHYPGFTCNGCWRRCSGFSYFCGSCFFLLDVVCALMPPSITHESHGKTHILHMSRRKPHNACSRCTACMRGTHGMLYECSNCRQLTLHAQCALLPTTLTKKFDRRPLKLTTSTKISFLTSTNDADADDSYAEHSEAEMQHICDACEMNIDKREWFYSCKQRDNSFHINCIPFFNQSYEVKYGVSVDVNFHDSPLTLVAEDTVSGYHCDLCRMKFGYMYINTGLIMGCAYECTKCNYRVHGFCAWRSSDKIKIKNMQ